MEVDKSFFSQNFQACTLFLGAAGSMMEALLKMVQSAMLAQRAASGTHSDGTEFLKETNKPNCLEIGLVKKDKPTFFFFF